MEPLPSARNPEKDAGWSHDATPVEVTTGHETVLEAESLLTSLMESQAGCEGGIRVARHLDQSQRPSDFARKLPGKIETKSR